MGKTNGCRYIPLNAVRQHGAEGLTSRGCRSWPFRGSMGFAISARYLLILGLVERQAEASRIGWKTTPRVPNVGEAHVPNHISSRCISHV